MRLGKGKRKLLRWLYFTLAALLVFWVASPVWFPWVLRPIAGMCGAHYGRYERNGYRRFTVEQVTFTNKDAKVRAERLAGLTPPIWLWHLLTHHEGWTTNEPFVRVSGWQYEAIPSGRPGRGSTYTNAQDVSQILQRVTKWVPSAVLSNGTVLVEKTVVDLPAATWG